MIANSVRIEMISSDVGPESKVEVKEISLGIKAKKNIYKDTLVATLKQSGLKKVKIKSFKKIGNKRYAFIVKAKNSELGTHSITGFVG